MDGRWGEILHHQYKHNVTTIDMKGYLRRQTVHSAGCLKTNRNSWGGLDVRMGINYLMDEI